MGIGIAGGLAMPMGVTAIQIADGKRTERNLLLATPVFGASVAVVHFSAMRWTTFLPGRVTEVVVPVLANPQVAIIVLLCLCDFRRVPAVRGQFHEPGIECDRGHAPGYQNIVKAIMAAATEMHAKEAAE